MNHKSIFGDYLVLDADSGVTLIIESSAEVQVNFSEVPVEFEISIDNIGVGSCIFLETTLQTNCQAAIKKTKYGFNVVIKHGYDTFVAT